MGFGRIKLLRYDCAEAAIADALQAKPGAAGCTRAPVFLLLFTGAAQSMLEARQAPQCGRLFCRPRFCAAQRCRFRAAFDLHGRLQPGPRHFQQDLAVPLRFGLAGPTQTLLGEFAEFCGRCRHARARP
jgi:hypothetical protein